VGVVHRDSFHQGQARWMLRSWGCELSEKCPFSVNAPADRLGRDHANAAVQVGLVLARFDEFERFGFAMPAPVPGFAGTDCIRLDFSEMLYHLNSPFELDRESSI
jgi:hypothetical protein